MSHITFENKTLRIGMLGFKLIGKTTLYYYIATICFTSFCNNGIFTATKNGLDGTDVRLLKQLAEKFNFDYNIMKPATFYAAMRLVSNYNFC